MTLTLGSSEPRSSKVHQDFDLDDTHPGILGAKPIHQDILEDSWASGYSHVSIPGPKSEEPQDRRRHVILCIGIIVIIHMRIRGKCVLRSDIS